MHSLQRFSNGRLLQGQLRTFHNAAVLAKRLNIDSDKIHEEVQKQRSGDYQSSIPEYGTWSEHLASDSEAIIKSERAPEKSIEELQQETIEVVQTQAELNQFPHNKTHKKK